MRYALSLLTLVTAVFLTTSTSLGQAPEDFSFQGFLKDDLGSPLDTTVTIVTKLYDGATLLHEQTHNDVEVVSGLFELTIADTDTIAFDRPIDLGLTVGGDPELSPRTPLLMAPYAQSLVGLRVYPNENASLPPRIIGGHSSNSVGRDATGGTISGGGATGVPNFVFGSYGTVSGGADNQSDEYGSVGGGDDNHAGSYGSVGGGAANSATGTNAVVGGGIQNNASGLRSTIPGGKGNTASGIVTFAAGELAAAVHPGAFVWQDGSTVTDTLFSSTSNEFTIRASGGVRILTGGPPDVSTGVFLGAGANSWNMISSKSAKTDFEDIDPREYLKRLAELNIKEWKYKSEPGDVTHVGPFAEDFHEAFRLGTDSRMISSIDADGVALVAIQGLYQLVEEQAAVIEKLQSRLDELE